ncbi:MAG TPA: UDP-N-acetylmuramate--L-alanine ligase [Bacteroidia bacterium]|nr:UDP-N-acetylmuramate--L-alanine ligase [Bacteroidia bacterium]
MKLNAIRYVYFLGIGGIGMSALARYFQAAGKKVAGYDRTRTALTDELAAAGMEIHFEDDVKNIPAEYIAGKEKLLVVWTPALPPDHRELNFFRDGGFTLMKRARVLGIIAENSTTIAVAGTHGKTTTTTLTAHLLRTSGIDSSAFLGGISGNYHTNLLLGKNIAKENVPAGENILVAEADEYDRSFHWLHPEVAIVTSADPDHLDIYGNRNEMDESYRKFISQVKRKLITRRKVLDQLGIPVTEKVLTYSLEEDSSDAFAKEIRVEDGFYHFDLVIRGKKIEGLKLGLPGRHNVENAVAAVTAAKEFGIGDESVKSALASFRGVQRRFDIHLRDPECVYIDDYGHHPAELKACISSVRELFPGKKIAGVFQPHLYSRTRDFADEFAQSLDLLDAVFLMEIYPARELPVPGVTSSMLLGKINVHEKCLVSDDELLEKLRRAEFDVLITMGAGNIDRFVEPVTQMLKEKIKNKTS